MFIEKNRDSPLSTSSISTVLGSVWFFRFSNDKIFENPAGEKNSQKYLTDFIKELVSIFKRQSKITEVKKKLWKSQKKLSNKQNLK